MPSVAKVTEGSNTKKPAIHSRSNDLIKKVLRFIGSEVRHSHQLIRRLQMCSLYRTL